MQNFKLILIILIIVASVKALSAQTPWSLTTDIQKHDHYLLEGNIGGQQAVEMYLKPTWISCGTSPIHHLNDRILRGWYRHLPNGAMIPLIGSMNDKDPDSYLRLFVPRGPLDTLNGATCELTNYKERFISENCCDIKQMQWKTQDMTNYELVELKVNHPFSWDTEAYITLKIGGVAYTKIDLSLQAGIPIIQDIEVLAKAHTPEGFFAIVEFGHSTKPGSGGSGHCGAGYEAFLGFLHIDQTLQLEKFEFHQTESCYWEIDEGLFTFDPMHPEKGIFKNE